MFGGLGFTEIILIVVLILVFFGPERLPEMARSAGKLLREFRGAMNEVRRELEEAERPASRSRSRGEKTGEARPGGPIEPPAAREPPPGATRGEPPDDPASGAEPEEPPHRIDPKIDRNDAKS